MTIGRAGRTHRPVHVRFARGLKLSHHIVDIGGIVIEKSLAAFGAHPLTANEVFVDLRSHN